MSKQTERELFIEEGQHLLSGLFFWIRRELDMTKTGPDFRRAFSEIEGWALMAKTVAHGGTVAEARRHLVDMCREDFGTRDGGVTALTCGPEGWELLSTTRPLVEIRDGELRAIPQKPEAP